MGFLMFAGLVGTMGYMAHYAKNETKSIIGDTVIQSTHNDNKDKKIIEENFTLICKRCGIKVDLQGCPLYKNHYRPCVAYLQYQGFKESVANHFKEIYLEKYEKKYKKKDKEVSFKHSDLLRLYYDTPNKETKIFRYWHSGNTKGKCDKLMNNMLWSTLVDYYSIVPDGSQNVEVWTITAPQPILEQINKIYDEVCYLSGFYSR